MVDLIYMYKIQLVLQHDDGGLKRMGMGGGGVHKCYFSRKKLRLRYLLCVLHVYLIQQFVQVIINLRKHFNTSERQKKNSDNYFTGSI